VADHPGGHDTMIINALKAFDQVFIMTQGGAQRQPYHWLHHVLRDFQQRQRWLAAP
jgi:ABC-type sugar transport system permease subunit